MKAILLVQVWSQAASQAESRRTAQHPKVRSLRRPRRTTSNVRVTKVCAGIVTGSPTGTSLAGQSRLVVSMVRSWALKRLSSIDAETFAAAAGGGDIGVQEFQAAVNAFLDVIELGVAQEAGVRAECSFSIDVRV